MKLCGGAKEDGLERTKGLNAYQLKWIAIITMLIDHCYKVFYIFLLPLVVNLFHVGEVAADFILLAVGGVGCVTMPIFAFFIAEGCRYTRNIKLYIVRLFLFAIVAEVPFQMLINAITGAPFSLKFGMTNILFTFALGAIACYGFQYLARINDRVLKWIVPLLCAAIAFLLQTDYGAFGVLFVFISYVITNQKAKLLTLAGLIFLFRGLVYAVRDYLANGYNLTFLYTYLVTLLYTLLAVLLLAAYNGERGRRSKYFFYIFYPSHMLILGLIPMLIA